MSSIRRVPLSRPKIPLALLVLIGLCGPQAVNAADDAWPLLKKPGHIVLLRHSNAPGSVPESNSMNFKDCSIQRNLDADGRAQAARIGDAFHKHGIRQVRLLSSQYCRAIETAKLTKLGPVKEAPVLNQVVASQPTEMREAGVNGQKLLKTVRGGPLMVLVSHVTNIESIAGVSLSSGEMAVVHLDKTGAVVVDGRIAVP